jgi:hypothetical protein
LNRGNHWGAGKRMGREGGGRGGQYTSNLGSEWTGIVPHAQEGFQVSKRDSGTGEGSSKQRGTIKGIARDYQRDHPRVIKGIVPCASRLMSILYISC